MNISEELEPIVARHVRHPPTTNRIEIPIVQQFTHKWAIANFLYCTSEIEDAMILEYGGNVYGWSIKAKPVESYGTNRICISVEEVDGMALSMKANYSLTVTLRNTSRGNIQAKR
jgi:hypothetical protein